MKGFPEPFQIPRPPLSLVSLISGHDAYSRLAIFLKLPDGPVQGHLLPKTPKG